MKYNICLAILIIVGSMVAAQANQVVKGYPALFDGDTFFPMPAFLAASSSYIVVAQVDKNSTDSLRFALVAADGTVLSVPNGIAINAKPTALYNGTFALHSVSANADSFMIAWADSRSGRGKPYVARVSASGSLLDSSGIAIPAAGTASDEEFLPSIASDGTNYLVVWVCNTGLSRIVGLRVDPSGHALDAAPFTIATTHGGYGYPMVVYSGTEYFIAYTDWRNGDSNMVASYGARVTVGGSVVGTGIQLVADGVSFGVALASSGANLLLVYGDADSYKAIHLTSAGDVADRPSLIGTVTLGMAAGFDGSRFLVFGEGISPGQAGNEYGYYVPRDGDVPLGYAGFDLGTSSQGAGQFVASFSVASQGGGVALGAGSRGYVLITSKPSAASCSMTDVCASGFCVDGVCCATACAGGAAGCQACSAAAGNTATPGTCGPIRSGVTCRTSVSICDIAETCDGSHMVCPTDEFAPASVECRAGTAACDPAESCTGSAASCPSDVTSCNIPDAGAADAQVVDASPPDDSIPPAAPDVSVLPNGGPDATATQDAGASLGAAVEKVSIIGCAVATDGRNSSALVWFFFSAMGLVTWIQQTRRRSRSDFGVVASSWPGTAARRGLFGGARLTFSLLLAACCCASSPPAAPTEARVETKSTKPASSRETMRSVCTPLPEGCPLCGSWRAESGATLSLGCSAASRGLTMRLPDDVKNLGQLAYIYESAGEWNAGDFEQRGELVVLNYRYSQPGPVAAVRRCASLVQGKLHLCAPLQGVGDTVCLSRADEGVMHACKDGEDFVRIQ